MVQHALAYYDQGQNCAQCLLSAAKDVYGLPVTQDWLNGVGPLASGYGVGGFCAVPLAATLILGVLFDEITAKQLRTCFFCYFQNRYHCLNCAGLSRGDCRALIADGAAFLQTLIDSEQK